MSRFVILAAIAYVLLAGASVAGLVAARNSVLSGNPAAADADWKKWRTDAAKQDGKQYPVQRRVPKSDEPPQVVILRDHFAATVFGLLVPLSALYFFAAWITHGMLRGKCSPHAPREVSSRGA